MKKLLIAVYGLLVGLQAVPSYAENPSFNTSTNVLTLPTVSIGNVNYYNINVLLNPSAFGNGWLLLPEPPDCILEFTCTDTQPQLISITISGPDAIPAGTSATYYAQSKWYRYYINDTKIVHEITSGDSANLTINLSGSSAAVIEGNKVTAKNVTEDTNIVLSVYNSYNGVVAQTTKIVTVLKTSYKAPLSAHILNFTHLFPGRYFQLDNGQWWTISATSTCVIPQTEQTGTDPQVTIFDTANGKVMQVDGSPTSCPVEQILFSQ